MTGNPYGDDPVTHDKKVVGRVVFGPNRPLAEMIVAAKRAIYRRAYRAGIEAALEIVDGESSCYRAGQAIRALPDLTQDAPEGGKTTANDAEEAK